MALTNEVPFTVSPNYLYNIYIYIYYIDKLFTLYIIKINVKWGKKDIY